MAAGMSRLSDGLILVGHYLAARRRAGLRDHTSLQKHQQGRWQKLRAHVLAKSPFYAALHPANHQDCPVMDKQSWMDAFDRINTVGLSLSEAFAVAERAETTRDFSPMWRGVSIGLSTGTSGARGVFLASHAERLQWAGTLLAKMLPQGLLTQARIGLLLRAGSNLYDTLSGGLRLKFQYFDLTRPFNDVLAELDRYHPTILVGPPSVLALAADATLAGRIRLKPARVIAAAEVLDDIDAARIRAAFNVPIEQIYQATEGFLAHTCVHGTLHLNEDVLIVEKAWIDRETRRFAPIVTDLYRQTQPVIRYRLNDVLVERATPCPCGSCFTVIERIEGREDDIVWLRSRTSAEQVPAFADVLSRAVLNAGAAIQDYRIEQRMPDVLHVGVSPAPTIEDADRIRMALSAGIDRLGASVPTIIMDGMIERGDERKYRRVRRLCEIVHA
jgi:putative adenylate-forming enzyme